MAKPKKKQEQEEPIPMAPMIDMVFLLLVFFMTVSTVAQSVKTIELELPESETAPVPEDASDRGIVSIDADGKYYIAGETPISLEQVKARIKTQVQRNPELKLQIRAAQKTEFRHIKKALKACASVGAYDIVYSTYQAK